MKTVKFASKVLYTQPPERPYTRRNIVIFKGAKLQICAIFRAIGAIAQKKFCANPPHASTYAADLHKKKKKMKIKKPQIFFLQIRRIHYTVHIDTGGGFTKK